MSKPINATHYDRIPAFPDRDKKRNHIVKGIAWYALFIARVPPGFRPSAGEVVRLRVDLARVHLFDPETGALVE